MSSRKYNSPDREAKSKETKGRILAAAKMLFHEEGFDLVTVERLAKQAGVSAPLIYSLYQSKRGVLKALMDEALPTEKRAAILAEETGFAVGAKLARQMYDAERLQMDLLRGASMLAPELKVLEREQEERRYKRQEASMKELHKKKGLAKGLSLKKARDILWALTGRDMYRLFVIERGWSSDEYEKWLRVLLEKTLLPL